MNRTQAFNGLELDNHGAFDNQVDIVRAQWLAAIQKRHLAFFLKAQAMMPKFDRHRLAIDRLEQTGSQRFVYLDRASNNTFDKQLRFSWQVRW